MASEDTKDQEEPTKVYNGKCYCGEIKFEVTVTPEMKGRAMYCHCENCRRSHSSPLYHIVLLEPNKIKFTEGEDLINHFRREEDCPVERWFCRNCGTRVANKLLRSKTGMSGMMGFFPTLLSNEDQHNLPEFFRPKLHFMYAQRVVQLPEDDLRKI